MDSKRPIIERTAIGLTVYLSVLFIACCLVYLCACPSPGLATAVGAEVVAVVVGIMILNAKVWQLPQSLMDRVPVAVRCALHDCHKSVQWCRVAVLSIVALAMTTDFIALTLAVAGSYRASSAIYAGVPVSYWIGLHPAFSLEMLAGALVQSHKFDKAEPLYSELLAIRMKVCGENSDLAGAIFCDMGDFCIRQGKQKLAEAWYRRSVAQGQHTGRAYAALATVLRETGHYSESEADYLKALTIRKRVYGMDSRQYKDTLNSYEKLQKLMRRRKEA